MKVVIAGDRNCTDYDFLLEAIKQASTRGIEITEVVSGTAKGADELGEQYARLNNLPVVHFRPNWDDVSVPGAIVKQNQWGKNYNARAGFERNEKMAMYADAVIALQPDGDTKGTQDMIKRANEKQLKLYIHTRQSVNENCDIPF